MVDTELSLQAIANSENTLETHLENINPAYRQAREIYNTLINKTTNPLLRNGLASNKESFLIILLEKILRNTEAILEQNNSLQTKLKIVEEDIIQLKTESFEPLVTAGNKISSDLKLFETGFQLWNTKFEKFQEIFNTWDKGFKNFENNLNSVSKFLQEFSDYWKNKTDFIHQNLNKIEQHIIQWNDEIIGINSSIDNLQKRFIDFQQRQTSLVSPRLITQAPIVSSFSNKQTYQVLPSNNHQWKL